MANETTAKRLSKYRAELVGEGFSENEIQTLVIEAARHLVNKESLTTT